MNTVIIEGKAYGYKIKGGAVKDYEKKTGTSIFKLDQDNISNFTSISDFLLKCVTGLKESILDEVDFNEQIEILGQMLSGKKQIRVSEELKPSKGSHTTMELPLENGNPLPETRTRTLENTLSKPLSANELERLIDGTLDE